MADYWVSQARKFCEFCKCWITDNKPSVEFHERGKRHKENVQKKIDELRKRSGEKAKQQEELDAGLAHVEKAALEALKKDLARDPSLAAQYGVKLKTSAADNGEGSGKEKAAMSDSSAKPNTAAPTVKIKEWFEAKSPEGYSYYWNVTTNESVWEPPEEFVSLAEQEGYVEQPADSTTQEAEEEEKEEQEEEEVIKEPPPKVYRVDPVGTRGAAYGAWETIREEPPPEPEPEPEPAPPNEPPALDSIPLPGDIPLPGEIPLPADIPLPAQAPVPEPQSIPFPIKKDRFKEKTVSSLGPSSGGSVEFKKRKIASGARNVRQRDDDD